MGQNAPVELDRALTALSAPYRRQLLVALQEQDPGDAVEDPLDLVGTDSEQAATEIALVHCHLPKLEEMGYITWNRDTGTVGTGPEWEAIAPLVELLSQHRDELPDEWFGCQRSSST